MLITLLCLSLFLFFYPFIVYPAILKLLPKVESKPKDISEDDISIALVFCAYNEESALEEKILNLRKLKATYPNIEIAAYSDASDDKTDQLLHEASDILDFIRSDVRLGKANGMQLLVEKIRSDIVVFTDANVILDIESIQNIKKYFNDNNIGTVAGRLKYTNASQSITASIGTEYWSLEEKIKKLESQTGSTMGADGSIFATRRKIYPNFPQHVLDDLTVSIEPLFRGMRVISASDVIAYERSATDSKDEYSRKKRIACRAMNTHIFLRKKLRSLSLLDKFKYISHKYLRWFSPFFLLASFLLATSYLIVIINLKNFIIFLTVITIIFCFILKICPQIIRKKIELLNAFVATGHGVLLSFLGYKYQTWSPPKSRN
jgi:cellulose synthase/poly-beta-1,6-N-acetylglucosamine synthase-like glycosyltransferase